MLSYLIILGAGYLALLLFLRWREPSMIYYPDRHLTAAPAQKFEDVWLTTSDGVKIHGWFVPAAATNAPTILFLHGNAGNISHRLEKLAIFHALGVNTLIIDYRGYGQSDPRRPDEQGTYRDAHAAYDWLTQRRAAVILYGESLGAAVAVDLATRGSCAGLILEEPFTSVAEVGQKMFPFVPARLIVRNQYDSLGKMPRVRVPLLILHSREDEMFPFSHAERLFAAAPAPKRLVELRGGHNDAFLVSAAFYRQAVAEFLASH